MACNLFICETPFQVLASLLLIFDGMEQDTNDFIVVDTMSDYEGIAERLLKLPCVNYAFAANTKSRNCGGHNRLDMFKSFPERWKYRSSGMQYNKLFCRNYTTPITEAAFRYFKKNNPLLSICIIDEGYSSYTSEFWNSHKSISSAHKFINYILSGQMDYLYKNIAEAKFFLPDLMHVNLPFPKTKMFKSTFCVSTSMIESINTVFEYKEEMLIEDGQCIFFEECFSFDTGNNEDLKIVEKVAQALGKENVIIKLHPRSKADRFSPLGYNVMKYSKCAWEVFALNNQSKRITLLAYSSGALMNYLLLSRNNMHSVFLYNVFPHRYRHMNDPEIHRWFQEFEEKYKPWICAPSSMDEVVEIIKQNNKNCYHKKP